MEGYTNVIGSSYDFDDLDIEGRVVDEWNADEDYKNTSKNEPIKALDERTLLNERVKLDNGQQADVFSVVRKKDNVWYTCHVCSDTVAGFSGLRQHANSSRHRTNMSRPVHPCAKFVKLDPKENLSLEPGEPVPPGLEETIIKNALIQPKLDSYKSPLIGLEFMVELTESTLDETEYYFCLLCDKTGSERNMFIHFTSIFHYMKYLSMYFPTVAKKLQSLPNKMMMKKAFGLVVTDIIKDIEEKYGRLKPQTVTYSDFYFQGRKAELHKAAFEGPHFRELDGELFDEKATAENIIKKNREVIAAPPVMTKIDMAKSEQNVEGSGIAFNKTSRVNVDKKQLRSREEEKRDGSSDVEIVNVTHKTRSPGKKKHGRSRSLSSISSASSSSSRRATRYRSSSRHRSKQMTYRNYSRSRSRSPGYRYRRYERRSPSYGRRYSPSRRSRSPHGHARPHYHRSHHDSRSRSPKPYRIRVDSYGRQVKEYYDSRTDRYRREKSPEGRGTQERQVSAEEKIRWEKFREELQKVESLKLEKLKYHEKNPEKHPQYPEEWKAFWNRRYNELQRSGIDPSKHDFKPEWIAFWTKRMKELYEEDLGKAKEELKKKFDLPEDPGSSNTMPWKYHQRRRNNTSPGLVDISPPTPEKKDVIADIKTTWKAFTGSDIKETPKRPLSPWEEDTPSTKRKQASRSPSPTLKEHEKLLEDMPQRKSRTSALIFVLRKLTVLEQQLGSLAPKVFELMSQSLALEKIKEDASLDLLFEEENSVFLETVREKLIALLCAGVVPRNFVNTARSAIKNTDIALYLAGKKQRSLPVETVRSVVSGIMPSSQLSYPPPHLNPMTSYPPVQPLPKSEPLVVPGVGQVDKVSIAQQIAAALVEQGKTNVTEAELEQLINAVVGMAEASAHSSQPMTTAHFLQRLQSMQNPTLSAAPTTLPTAPAVLSLTQPQPVAPLLNQEPLQTAKPVTLVTDPPPSVAFGALKLLQSAYNETSKPEQDSPKPDSAETALPSNVISDVELASNLSVFNKMSVEDQPAFINRLKTTNPEMYKRLCPFIPSSIVAAADNPSHSQNSSNTLKRSPINIALSKEKSEQKIKPISSGRLSPFSQRSGGANPAVGEKVVVVDDDDDDKSDVKIISDSSAKQQSSRGNEDLSKYKSNESDVDDDDDDYSFEDVYKAAQEKLKQEDDHKSNQSVSTKGANIAEPKKSSSDNSNPNMPLSNQNWGNLGNLRELPFTSNENLENKDKAGDGKLKSQPLTKESTFGTQQPLYSDANEIPSHPPTRPVSYQNSNQSYPYQGSTVGRQDPVDPYMNPSQPPLGGSSIPTYVNKDHYLNDPYYSKGNSEYYDKNQYPADSAYPTTRETYGNSVKNTYSSAYNEPYSAPPYNTPTTPTYGNPAYRNPMSTYSDNHYNNSGPPQYGNQNYSQGQYHPPPNPPVPPSRYPSQGYPPY